MIDLTPLDVRKKRDDFRKGLRGYETQEVDGFLELVAERLEELVKENLKLTERAERLAQQVDAQAGRERAVHEALVTAQELRDEIREQAGKEADRIRRDAERDALHREREAELKARDILAEAERELRERQAALEELERRRTKFLNGFRQLLQREMDVVAVEEGRSPLASVAVELDLGGGRFTRDDEGPATAAEPVAMDEIDVTDEPAEADSTPARTREEDLVSAAAPGEAVPPADLSRDADAEERPPEDADVHALAASMWPGPESAADGGHRLDIDLLAARRSTGHEEAAPEEAGPEEPREPGEVDVVGPGHKAEDVAADGPSEPSGEVESERRWPDEVASNLGRWPMTGAPTLEALLGDGEESEGPEDDR